MADPGRAVVRVAALAGGLAALGLVTHAAPAAAQDLSRLRAELTDIEGQADSLDAGPLQGRNLRSATWVEERLTDGELYFRLQDYVRASIIFTDIVENHEGHRAYPDALFLLGESLFRANDYLGARTRFRQILDRSSQPGFGPYVQRALGRLIEIAVQTRDFERIEDYFARLSRLPPQEIEASTAYFRAKYLYNRSVPSEQQIREAAEGGGPPPPFDREGLEQARLSFAAVAEGSPYYPQARYFIGVIHARLGQFPQAIDAFARVLRAPVTEPEHRDVIELAYLSLGRLQYRLEQLDQAVESYQAIPRTSTNFDVALYEIAWVYIRMGDSTRAERALEVLSVATPDSKYIPDGRLLRAKLLLRNGQLDDAEDVFRDVRGQFGPVRRSLEEIVAEHDDPQAFFRELVRENLDAFDPERFMPEEAQRWVDVEGDMSRALAALGDLSQARRMVRETSELVARLDGALRSPNRINVFADLRRERERTTALRNRLYRVRRQLVAADDGRGGGGGEVAALRQERQELERLLSDAPTDPEGFENRNSALLVRYRQLERDLRDLEVELLGIEARVVATDRFVTSTEDERDAAGVGSIRAELAQHRGAVEDYRAAIDDLRVQLETGRLQVGVGDQRFETDERNRERYLALVEQERRLRPGGGGELDRMFGQAARIERTLDQHDVALDQIVERRATEMQRLIADESRKLEDYRAKLVDLEREAELVVGQVTYDNFNDVRDRFYDLVLEADVGRVDVAWARREEHRLRVDLLSRERTRELQTLDDEFRDILDEREDSGAEDDL